MYALLSVLYLLVLVRIISAGPESSEGDVVHAGAGA